MTKNSVYLLFLFTGTAILMYVSCTLDIAGGSSDHGNAMVAGIITDTLNNGVADITVRLIPADFNPAQSDFDPDSLTAVTDDSGLYKIDGVPKGTYTLTGGNATHTLTCIKKRIAVDTLDIDTISAVVKRPGHIIIFIDSTIWTNDSMLTVYIPGTNIYAQAAHINDTVYLTNVPSGNHTVMIYSEMLDTTITIDKEFSNFLVVSGGITNFTLYPEIPRGPVSATINDSCIFNTIFKYNTWIPDIIVEFIEYRFAWGDTDTSHWSPDLKATHRWLKTGTYQIRAQLRYLPSDTGIVNQLVEPFYSGWSKSAYISITTQ